MNGREYLGIERTHRVDCRMVRGVLVECYGEIEDGVEKHCTATANPFPDPGPGNLDLELLNPVVMLSRGFGMMSDEDRADRWKSTPRWRKRGIGQLAPVRKWIGSEGRVLEQIPGFSPREVTPRR